MKIYRPPACLILVFITLTSAGQITFRDCGSTARTVEKVEVSNCNLTTCNVVKGQTYEILVYFTSGEKGFILDIDLRGKASIITTPILVTENGGGCNGLNIGCPFPGGAKLVHNTTIVVAHDFLETPAVITHKLVADNLKSQICIETDIRIVAS